LSDPGRRLRPSKHARGHEHERSAEYLYPADAEVLNIYEKSDQLYLDVATACPGCSETVALTAPVESIADTGVDRPLDDDYYD